MKYRKREWVATELTWEEKNPTDYRYRSSKAIERLEKWVNSKKRVGRETAIKRRKS